jgi:hypothetical protein
MLGKEKVRHPLRLRFMTMLRISKLPLRRNGPKTRPPELLPHGTYFLDEGHPDPEWAARAVRNSAFFSRECDEFMEEMMEGWKSGKERGRGE